MLIVGITGTLGAGKGTIVDYLEKEKGFAHYSVRGYLEKEMARRGLANNRDNMVITANDLRKKNSPSFIVEELYNEAKSQDKNAIIESIRTPGEVDLLIPRSGMKGSNNESPLLTMWILKLFLLMKKGNSPQPIPISRT